jgi:hypothetical protein
MSVRTTRRRLGLAAVTATAVFAALVVLGAAGSASAAKPPPPPTTNGGCPTSIGSFLQDNNVGASVSTDVTNLSTYTFRAFDTNTDPNATIPGLVGYCAYANKNVGTVVVQAHGDNGALWKGSKPTSKEVSFQRPAGDSSNIGFHGQTVTMGTAQFSTDPGTQTLLLHVSDTATCSALYGAGSTTCFVLPRPVAFCDVITGDSNAGYNAIPNQVQNCSPPSYAFEGNFANEFGDEVTLDTSHGTKLVSMKVDFQSYGCSDSGKWYGGDVAGTPETCVTTAGETFQVPGGITAKIYDSSLNVIATSNVINPDIPYRPSADSAKCSGTGTVVPQGPNDANGENRWFDTVSETCKYSLSVPLTFTFPAGTTFTSGQDVIWTVQFNTSHGGYAPIVSTLGSQGCNALEQGCGYDSLNVGTLNYTGAPYAGHDVDNNTVYISNGNSVYAPPFVSLAAITSVPDWGGFRPLGEIVLGP